MLQKMVNNMSIDFPPTPYLIRDIVYRDRMRSHRFPSSDVMQVASRYSVSKVTRRTMTVFVDDFEVSRVLLEA